MKLAIIGRTEILLDTARELIAAGHQIVLIVTAKAAAEYSKGESDFRDFAHEIGADFYSTARVDKDLKDIPFEAELAVSLNYVGIIPQAFIDRFPLGILNAHGGDLPRYRGNACQAWAIINGESHIGLCVHKMIGGEVDAGDIVSRDRLPLETSTRVGEVYEWMSERIPEMFVQAIDSLSVDANYVLEKQSTDPAAALRCYPRNEADGRIDWQAGASEIERLVNASSEPFSGAFTFLDGKKFVIWRAETFTDDENYCAVPGQIVQSDRYSGSTIVATGQGKLRILDSEYEGVRAAPSDFAKSIRLRFE